MFNTDRKYYVRLSEESGFQRDIIEKVHRLIKILEYVNGNAFLRERLLLKGGTALNLTVFDLPRLSVDIDFDFHSYDSKDVMLRERDKVNEILVSYLERENYTISRKSKTSFSLTSIVASYENSVENLDNIKIEINYSLRHHIFPPMMRKVNTELFGEVSKIMTLNVIELLASKTVAFYDRLAARDVYDLFNAKRYNIITDNDKELYSKSVIFYGSVSSNVAELNWSTERVNEIQESTFRRDLYPMLIKGVKLNADYVKSQVKEFLQDKLHITDECNEYLREFSQGRYKPELLFSGELLENIREHPMAIWKIMNINKTK